MNKQTKGEKRDTERERFRRHETFQNPKRENY